MHDKFIDFLFFLEDMYKIKYEDKKAIVELFKESSKNKKKINDNKVAKTVEDWIDSWIALFPENTKNLSGKLLRMDREGCLKKMILFVKTHPFTVQEIFSATHEYLEEKSKDNYAYARCAIFFIDKRGEGSDLAAYCENSKKEIKIPNKKNENYFI